MQKGKKSKPVFIYGKHALKEALSHAPHVVRKAYLAPQVDDAELRKLLAERGVPVSPFKEGAVGDIERGATHQGVVARIEIDELMKPYEAFINGLTPSPDTLLVILDELTDPHNVGAVIRSAAAFGAAAVLLPQHNQAPVTGAVAKVSAGMAFRIPLVSIGNVNSTMRDLKERGFWIYGLAGEEGQSLTTEAFTAPTVLVVGNEADGIRHRTRELCDVLLSIPIAARTESLNAASAAGVALYAWSVQHPGALR